MKMPPKRTVLVVDDDEINLMILIKGAQAAGYAVKSFSSGDAAWEYLSNASSAIDMALIDKMMPGISGIELLRRMKTMPSLRHIPVILQTGDVGLSQMREGLENGAYYYLTKPFHPEILTAILHSADNECRLREELLEHMKENHARFIGLMREGEFTLRTHAEARLLAATLAQAASYPEFAGLGLMELLSNAIEHGNWEIGYDRKRKCLLSGNWEQELASRGNNPSYGNRSVRVAVERRQGGLHLIIADEGKGFAWQRHIYDTEAAERLNEPSGRGIAKAMIMLDDVRYVGCGNEVHCRIGMAAALSAASEQECAVKRMAE